MQRILKQHQAKIRVRDEELQNVKAHNTTLIKEKAQITQEHIQEAFQTNMSLQPKDYKVGEGTSRS